jgi:predicted HicB family RNase H-like nuclease
MTLERRFTARVPEDDYRKLHVIAAMHGTSINSALCDAIVEYVEQWESTHGAIQVPVQEARR